MAAGDIYGTHEGMTYMDEYGNMSSYDPVMATIENRGGGLGDIEYINPLYGEDINNPMSPNYIMNPVLGGSAEFEYGGGRRWGGEGEGYQRLWPGGAGKNTPLNPIGDRDRFSMGLLDRYMQGDDYQYMDPRREVSFEPEAGPGGYRNPLDPRAMHYLHNQLRNYEKNMSTGASNPLEDYDIDMPGWYDPIDAGNFDIDVMGPDPDYRDYSHNPLNSGLMKTQKFG
tara:strand:+ start:6028 stop:6705 length:678 start_codon:yes stop_codon:yes gene_type:complete